jgi:hypothetical protein
MEDMDMKKAFVLILTLALVISLAACGGNTDPDVSGNSGGNSNPTSQGGDTTPSGNDTTPSGNNNGEDLKLSDVLSDLGISASDMISELDSATQQSFIDAVETKGYTVTINENGSMFMENTTTGEAFIQNASGSWTYQDANGNVTDYDIGN